MSTIRRAEVTVRSRTGDVLADSAEALRLVGVYLPSNYRAVAVNATVDGPALVLVEGTDVAGWTLDGYVIPRLQSGNIAAREVAA